MKWTPEKVKELRGLAHLGSIDLAAHFGCTRIAVISFASDHGIPIGRGATYDEQLRARWEVMLPRMRAAVRAAVLEGG